MRVLQRSPVGRLVRWLAAIPASIHTKLLGGFLIVTLLFVTMAVVSLLAQLSTTRQSRLLDQAHERVSAAQQIEYALARQMHFTALALLSQDEAAIARILRENNRFNNLLTNLEAEAVAEQQGLIGQIRSSQDDAMIVFNDPLPLANPAQNAVRMALAMQREFVPLRAAWNKRCYDLDLAIGIAQGYATLGAIGFEGRWEYTCIGGVANVAARLCGEAKGGQILTNQKMLWRIGDVVQAETLGDVALKGLVHPVAVANVTGLTN